MGFCLFGFRPDRRIPEVADSAGRDVACCLICTKRFLAPGSDPVPGRCLGAGGTVGSAAPERIHIYTYIYILDRAKVDVLNVSLLPGIWGFLVFTVFEICSIFFGGSVLLHLVFSA